MFVQLQKDLGALQPSGQYRKRAMGTFWDINNKVGHFPCLVLPFLFLFLFPFISRPFYSVILSSLPHMLSIPHCLSHAHPLTLSFTLTHTLLHAHPSIPTRLHTFQTMLRYLEASHWSPTGLILTLTPTHIPFLSSCFSGTLSFLSSILVVLNDVDNKQPPTLDVITLSRSLPLVTLPSSLTLTLTLFLFLFFYWHTCFHLLLYETTR